MKGSTLLRVAALCLIATIFCTQPAAATTTIKGSGASFPYQIYSLWFWLFGRDNKDIEMEYRPIGSGGGIKEFQKHLVDFAASDAAMNDKEISEVKEGVQLLPMTAGEVVLVYNLKGIHGLKLPRKVYPEIFLGKIKKWNDPAIAAANPGVELPDLDITVVTRVDSSGTNFVFTQHLCAISEEFKNGPGFGKKINWPAALKMESAPLNVGMIGSIKMVPGAIGYADFGYAGLASLEMASLENKEGKFVAPGLESGQAALSGAKIPENMIVWLTDPEGDTSYPITTYTWMMFYKKYDDPKKAEALRRMVMYCLDEGQKLSDRFGYIPLPANVAAMVRTASANIQ
ncbi:MAG: phosphate ABC transporter substrate-binding protein PstS [Pseudomonadota bacterium]